MPRLDKHVEYAPFTTEPRATKAINHRTVLLGNNQGFFLKKTSIGFSKKQGLGSTWYHTPLDSSIWK